MSPVYTTNGALAVQPTSALMSLFFSIGASRSNSNILTTFQKALDEDELKALAIVLYSRCIRGRGEDKSLSGQGERKVPRDLIHWYLKQDASRYPLRLLFNLPYLGRWDDLTACYGTPFQDIAADYWATAIKNKDVLSAKWATREDKHLQKALKINEAGLRKLLSSIRKEHIVEYKICEKKFDEIDYSKLPSLAGLRYTELFKKWDAERYIAFIEDKDTTVNAKVTLPHEVYANYKRNHDSAVASKFWDAMPKLDLAANILPIVDTSGSMRTPISDNSKTDCIDISISLGVYLAQNNSGYFKNRMITFSERPELVSLPDTKDVGELFDFTERIDWGQNTNFEKVYKLILENAIWNKVSPKDMPEYLLVLSDMQMDEATHGERDYEKVSYKQTELHLDIIQRKFKDASYSLPKIVFWNLRATNNGFPSQENRDGVVLISGFSPDIMKTVLKCEDINPEKLMLEVIAPFIELLL